MSKISDGMESKLSSTLALSAIIRNKKLNFRFFLSVRDSIKSSTKTDPCFGSDGTIKLHNDFEAGEGKTIGRIISYNSLIETFPFNSSNSIRIDSMSIDISKIESGTELMSNWQFALKIINFRTSPKILSSRSESAFLNLITIISPSVGRKLTISLNVSLHGSPDDSLDGSSHSVFVVVDSSVVLVVEVNGAEVTGGLNDTGLALSDGGFLGGLSVVAVSVVVAASVVVGVFLVVDDFVVFVTAFVVFGALFVVDGFVVVFDDFVVFDAAFVVFGALVVALVVGLVVVVA